MNGGHALLALLLLTVPAEAEPLCKVSTHAFGLQLARVEALSGTPDLQAVVKALGTQAELRGSFRDPAVSRDYTRLELVGSSDGAGLVVTLTRPP